jgi:hypothetical protein
MRHRHRRCAEPLIARPTRGRNQRKIKKGEPQRGIIATRIVEETPGSVAPKREYALHATKGYRAMRQ